MTRYQRSIMNKMDNLSVELQEDWQYRTLGKKERASKESEYKALKEKLEKTYKK